MTLVELPADKTVCGDVRETGRPGATSARALRGGLLPIWHAVSFKNDGCRTRGFV